MWLPYRAPEATDVFFSVTTSAAITELKLSCLSRKWKIRALS